MFESRGSVQARVIGVYRNQTTESNLIAVETSSHVQTRHYHGKDV